MNRYIKAIFNLTLVTLALWGGGFLWFAQSIPDEIDDKTTPTDAIVVLTGGSKRMEAGLELLQANLGKRLFISGVHTLVGPKSLERSLPEWPVSLQPFIDLGHEALDTRQNSLETKEWITKNQFTSLRLVTSSYHMKRSLAEFRHAMPWVNIIPNPVFKEAVHSSKWWYSAITDNLIIGEYHKFILAKIRIYFNRLFVKHVPLIVSIGSQT